MTLQQLPIGEINEYQEPTQHLQNSEYHPATTEEDPPTTKTTSERRNDEWHGNDFSTPESAIHDNNHTRICFHNAHGIRRKGTTLQQGLMDMLTTYQHYDIQILGISEHHLPMSDPGYRQKIHENINRCGPPSTIVHQFNSSTETSSKSGRLMGGTAIIGMNGSVGRLEPKGKGGDHMGRWSYLHFRRNNKPPLTVISIYQVCKQPTNKIGYTAWHQQRRALDADHRDEHPRKAFQADLSQFLEHLQTDKHDIIIGGDWNETILDSHSCIAALSLKYDLIDPWSHVYPHHPEIATFEFGSRRIDSILLSRSLIHNVRKIGYSPVGLMSLSDHRAIIIEFDTKQLFGNILDPLPTIAARGVRTKDIQSVTTYVETMHSHLLANNAFERGHTLITSNGFDSELVENLDEIIGISGDMGDARCHRRRPQWYSISLVQDRLELSHLQHYLNGLKSRKDRSAITHRNLLMIQRDQELPSDAPSRQNLIKEKPHLSPQNNRNRRSYGRTNYQTRPNS